jgi:hypothetical protein
MENLQGYIEQLTKSCDQKCIDNVIFSVGPVLALIAARGGVKSWLKFEIVSATIFALFAFVKPDLVLGYILKSPVKDYHRFLFALYGCYLIYGVLFPLFLLNSQDEAIYYGHFWAKIVVSIFRNLFLLLRNK